MARGLYPELVARAKEVIGVDLSAAAVRGASNRYPVLDAREANVLALPFADASFDVVVSNSTLDHFESHSTLCAVVMDPARLIVHGGKLVITLDNRMNPIVALRTSCLREPLHRLGVTPYFVGATCGPRRLARLLRGNGFDVVQTAAIMHCPPQLAAQIAVRATVGSISTLTRVGLPSRGIQDHHASPEMRGEFAPGGPSAYLGGDDECGVGVGEDEFPAGSCKVFHRQKRIPT
jgi:hypothetical protein